LEHHGKCCVLHLGAGIMGISRVGEPRRKDPSQDIIIVVVIIIIIIRITKNYS
jgi:hypothetical protein